MLIERTMDMKKITFNWLKRTEFYIALVIMFLSLFIQVRSGMFFSGNNIIDLLRALVVPGMFGLGTYIVIISGGFDVSFPTVAALSMYCTTSILESAGYTGSILLAFCMGLVFGVVLGTINGILVMTFRIPTLIITLGTTSIYNGILHGFLEAHEIGILPEPFQKLAGSVLLRTFDEKLQMYSELPTVFLMLIGLIVVVWFVMQKTSLGRYIFAIGGDISSAERIGIPINLITVVVYAIAGGIAGLTGITRAVMMNTCHPNTFNGMDMTVIAAVILGGTRASGGFGSITGVILGTALFAIVNNSLQLMGVPNYWQKFFLGALIIIGTGISAIQVMQKSGIHVARHNALKNGGK